ncbi:MAG: hypothetical protein EA421_11820 [Gemmatimonadales bacterium]|nr:MAG: hypothetical protein EA421_11820 [Gemmatimonadales bacterium]
MTGEQSTFDGSSHFKLAPGVRLEPFADGTAVLYSPEREETLSLNPTAALLCAYADGKYTFATVREQVHAIFPSAEVEIGPFLSCARELVERGFLVLEAR